MRHAWLAAGLLLAAGCVAPDAPAADTASSTTPDVAASLGNATGTLVVRARFVDLSPLADVNVTLDGDEARLTSADGSARFERVLPGAHNVTARKAAHRTAQLTVTVRAGETAEAEAVLLPDGLDQHAHEKGLFAHRDLYRFDGHFDCSATYVIITGDCFLLIENVTGRSPNVTTARNIIDFPLDRTWSELVVEMNWTVPEDAVESGMSLALEPAEAPADGHAAKYARVNGTSPLRLDLLPGVKHATATLDDKPNAEGGEVLRARAFVLGAAHDAGGAGFLGVGVAKDQRFTLWVSVFYGEAAPRGYTALR
jgi:hypothetical protein